LLCGIPACEGVDFVDGVDSVDGGRFRCSPHWRDFGLVRLALII